MDAPGFDLVRLVLFVEFGLGVGFMVATNVLAAHVLRPPQRLGFLWWHVTSISAAWLLVGIPALSFAAGRFGSPLTWRSFSLLGGFALFAVAQVIIFGVERARYRDKQARDAVEGRP